MWRACLQNPVLAPTGSQIPPTRGQLPTPITALPCSETSHRLLCLNNKLPCLAFKAFQDLVPGNFWLHVSCTILIHLPFPPTTTTLQSFASISDYLRNIGTQSQGSRGPDSSLKPEGAREGLGPSGKWTTLFQLFVYLATESSKPS